MKFRNIIIIFTLCLIFGIYHSCAANVAEYNIEENLLFGLEPENVRLSAGNIGGYGQGNEVLYDGAFTVSGFAGTRWAVESNILGASVEFNFPKIVTMNKMVIKNGYAGNGLIDDRPGTNEKQRLMKFGMYYWTGVKYIKIPLENNNSEEADTHFFEFDTVSTTKIKIVSEQSTPFRILEMVFLAPGSEYKEGRYEYTYPYKTRIKFNGAYLKYKNDEPELDEESGIMYVPVREFEEIMGLESRWFECKQSVRITRGKHSAVFKIGSTSGEVDGREAVFCGTPYLKESRVFVPLRDLAEALGGAVTWYADNKEIELYTEESLTNISRENRGKSPYNVECGGEEQTVFSTGNLDFVNYVAQEEETEVNLVYDGEIKSVVIKPFSKNIKYTQKGSSILSFSAKTGDKLVVVINGNKDRPLFLSVNKPIARPADDGNTLYFDKSRVYRIGKLELQDNQTVYIGDGVILDGTICAKGKKNIKIIGNGIIKNLMREYCTSFQECEGITLKGVTITNTNAWHNYWFKCNGIEVENCKIYGYEIYSDGIDLCTCSDVHIKDVIIRNEDDGVVMKVDEGLSAENITVEDAVIWSGQQGNSTEIGYELAGGHISNVTFRNIDVIYRGTKSAKFRRSAMSIHNSNSADVYDITYDNIRVEETEENLIYVERIGESEYGQCTGSIYNITYKNIQFTGGNTVPSVIRDSTPNPEKIGITFENCTYNGKKLTSIDDLKSCGFDLDGNADITFK